MYFTVECLTVTHCWSPGDGDGHLQAAACIRGGVPCAAGRGGRKWRYARRLRSPGQVGENQCAAEEAQYGTAGETSGKQHTFELVAVGGKV